MNYYEVAPLTYMADGKDLLTYASEDVLNIGDIVLIPLRNAQKEAIVINKTQKPPFKTKPVSKKLHGSPVISPERIQLAHKLREHYFCSLGEVLNAFLPVNYGKNRRIVELKITKPSKLEAKHTLTVDQQKILNEIITKGTRKPHLIYGVTGSGKTEIYMQLITNVIEKGKTAIVLVPEIALTPQTVSRFKSRFGDTVALLHSNMKETERFREWNQIEAGNKKVVIGPRSALFAPLNDLGIIIIDEAHETSYKQDSNPKYQTVQVAEWLSELTDSYLVLGSATPTVEQFYKAETGTYELHSLNNRIVQMSMPEVEIVDMRDEFHYGNKGILSEKLKNSIQATLDANKQVLLFQNRRGMSTFVSCRDCGHVETCPNCDIPLTFHYSDMLLRCHHCDFSKNAPMTCPECKSFAIKYFGTGTERIENDLKKLFGTDIRIIRMDSDTTKTRASHEALFEEIKQGKADIIVGTQMITKGWDLNNIDLVGVISADSLLYLPDYQAEERAFSLLLQVAGRSGRGKDNQGKVIVQTYNPDQKLFDYLINHDYKSFYTNELKIRKDLMYPPFARVVNLLYNNQSESIAKEEANVLAKLLQNKIDEGEIKATIVGPSPAFISKLRGQFRWQIYLKITDSNLEKSTLLHNYIIQSSNKGWQINADPNGI